MAVPALPGSFETGALGRLILKVANLAVLVCACFVEQGLVLFFILRTEVLVSECTCWFYQYLLLQLRTPVLLCRAVHAPAKDASRWSVNSCDCCVSCVSFRCHLVTRINVFSGLTFSETFVQALPSLSGTRHVSGWTKVKHSAP